MKDILAALTDVVDACIYISQYLFILKSESERLVHNRPAIRDEVSSLSPSVSVAIEFGQFDKLIVGR